MNNKNNVQLELHNNHHIYKLFHPCTECNVKTQLLYEILSTFVVTPQIYTRYTRLPILPCVMASSATGLNLGVLGFCRPHMQKQTQNKCVHDLCAPRSVLRMFVFMLRPQHMQVTYYTHDEPRLF